MTIEITETEMIARFNDALKQASSRATEMIHSELSSKPKIFTEFLNSLKVAAGSCHQLAHYQENPHFLDLRDLIERCIEVGQTLPTFTVDQAPLWDSISQSLTVMRDRGMTIATGRAMKRSDVLANLSWRQQKVSKKLEEEHGRSDQN